MFMIAFSVSIIIAVVAGVICYIHDQREEKNNTENMNGEIIHMERKAA